MEPFVGQIIPVGFNFAPVGWFLCQGQTLPIDQFTPLFSLIGTTYGGDGQSTFNLPDLRGRVPLHQGQGPGLSNYILGEPTGTENVTLLASQIGVHTHAFMTSANTSNLTTPASTSALGLATAGTGIFVYGSAPPNTNLSPKSMSVSGSSFPHENRQPLLCLNFIIAWAGVFPQQG
jgi:microcystin-dependent protein